MGVTPEQVRAGHALYTRRWLKIYDFVVLSYASRMAWKCPASRIVQMYDDNVSDNHLDVGVGSGYFLDRCRWPSDTPRIAMLDPNPHCLAHAGRRIARYKPEAYDANVLEPIRLDVPLFDSVGVNYVLHCLPGTIRSKAVVFEHLKPLVNPGGVIFGATMLHDGVDHNLSARMMMKRLNKRGVFSNMQDDLEGLWSVLRDHLSEPAIEVVGTAALFRGRV
jgi:SAM-dependent methyltransferase